MITSNERLKVTKSEKLQSTSQAKIGNKEFKLTKDFLGARQSLLVIGFTGKGKGGKGKGKIYLYQGSGKGKGSLPTIW